jgi:hypothetical protein
VVPLEMIDLVHCWRRKPGQHKNNMPCNMVPQSSMWTIYHVQEISGLLRGRAFSQLAETFSPEIVVSLDFCCGQHECKSFLDRCPTISPSSLFL